MLRGNKVYLKLIEEKDMEERAGWINDPDIQNTLNYDIPTSVSKTKAWFNKIILDNSRREFSIFTVDGDKYIGFCGLFNIQVPVMKAELHCVIGDKEYQRGGYGTEAYKLLTDYGFEELGLNRIYGYQLEHNHAAHRVVEKLGWKREGLLRNDLYSHGAVKDRYLVAITRQDWERRRLSANDSPEYKIGDKYEETVKISREMVDQFAKVSGDYSEIHMNHDYASKTRFGDCIAHGMLLGSIISGLIGMHLPGNGTVYVSQSCHFVAPCRVGADLQFCVRVKDCLEKGRLLLETSCRENGKLLMTGEAVVIPPMGEESDNNKNICSGGAVLPK